MPPAAVQACDPASRAAAIDQMEDRAFAAMKAATEQVARASRHGAVGAAGDAEWASYKRFRSQAEALRAQGACPPSPMASAAPQPAAALPASPQPASTAVASTAWEEPKIRRFRFEASGNWADRQPSAASRIGMQTLQGTTTQQLTYPLSATPTPAPVPAPVFPAPTTTNSVFQTTAAGPTADGPRPDVRGWSSGLTVSLDFAPQGYGQEGWRWTVSLSGDTAETRSDTAFPADGYRVTSEGPTQYSCPRIGFSPFITAIYGCRYDKVSQAERDQYHLPFGVNGAVSEEIVTSDSVSQTSQRLDARFGMIRDFKTGSPLGPLDISLGAELGVGWWTLDEHEQIGVPSGVRDFYRSANGPAGYLGLTGALGGAVRQGWPLRWSIQSALGYEVVDLTATTVWTFIGRPEAHSSDQNLSDQMSGRLGVRLDYGQGPLGTFVSLERRRDLSVVSNVTAPGADGRASKRFVDGTSMSVWPVYDSRLTLGVNYGF
ncbi:hypothetical protein [Caulobacter sp.]|uniref:hypothetical protein n=1 Tax=Caulobacter sp. TaxID=78 RepID=UPI003BB062FF